MTTVVFSADSFWQETKSVANPCKMQVTFWSENVGGWNDFTIEIQVPFHAPNFSMIYGDLFARISFFAFCKIANHCIFRSHIIAANRYMLRKVIFVKNNSAQVERR